MDSAGKDTRVELEKRLAAIRHVQGSIALLAPGRGLADELIEDRRIGRDEPRGSDRR